MTQPDVTLTDYGLALESALFSLLIYRLPVHSGQLRLDSLAFFCSVALASAAGGTVHGFFLDERGLGYKILWRFTLVMIGVTAFSGVRIGATMLMPAGTAGFVDGMAGVLFILYLLIALFLWQDFRLAILGYLPSLLILGAGFLVQFHVRNGAAAFAGCFGVCTMVIAALVQQLRVAISARYFDHNALYHVLQAAALWMLYTAVRPAMG